MSGSRVVHRAKAGGGRMPPVVRYPGGPEGRKKIARHCPIYPNRARRMRAVGMASPASLGEPQDAASPRNFSVARCPLR